MRIFAIWRKRIRPRRTATRSASFRPSPAAFRHWNSIEEEQGTAMATTAQPQTGAKPAASLTNEEILRYSRHLIMPEVGMEGQKRLKAARVLLIGTGGLGSPLGLYLAAAGVGTLGLVDFDVVDYSNLQRQIIHGTKDVGRPKLDSARDRILDINPNTQVELHEALFTSENALEIVKQYDLVVDG